MRGLSYSQDLYPRKIVYQNDTVIAVTIRQMDSISSKLIRLRELPALYALLDAKNEQITACNRIMKKDSELIDTLNVQISDYILIVDMHKKQNMVLSGIIKQEKKQARRIKFLTAGIISPISFIFGGIMALLITR